MKIQSSLLKSALIILVSSGFASAGDGTPLSARGSGVFTSFAGSRSAGMGNAGIALFGDGFLSRINPATWGGIQNVDFSATYGFSGDASEDNSIGQSSYYANGNFEGGIFALPISHPLGISLAGGFTPLTSYQYQINAAPDSTSLIAPYTYQRTGSGGLGEGFVGLSLSPFKWISLGGMFQYAFGRVQSTGTITFSSSAYQNTYLDNSMYLRGPAGTFGIVIDSLDELTGGQFLKGLNLAFYYKSSYNLHGSYDLESIYDDGLDTTIGYPAYGKIPPEIGFGIAKSFGDRFTALLDVRSQQLSKYQDTFYPQGTLGDVLFVGGGVEFVEGRDLASLFKNHVYRAGFYYQKTQFIVPTKSGGNKQLDELFLTAGTEFPISASASLDLAAQYGIRGLSSDFLLREHVFRLYVSISMGEIWFSRPEGD